MDRKEEEEKTITTVVAVVDWLKLPQPLTIHIISKFTSICDYARFGAVCVQWRSIFLQEYSYCARSFLPQPQLPLLMIPTPPPPPSEKKKNKNKYGNNYKKKTISFSFYRVTDGKIYDRFRLAMPRDRYVRGSGYGWLITVDDDEIGCSVQLMNPFLYPNYNSTMDIKLASIGTHPHEDCVPGFINYVFLKKAILSSDPITNPKDFMVMAIFSGAIGLAFCKAGDEAWTPIEHGWIRSCMFDLIYYEGKFYAVSQEGSVVVCNVAERTVTEIAGPVASRHCCKKSYLIVSANELFQVRKYLNSKHIAKQFNVFKLKRGETSTEWIEVKDLGDHAFFVGDSSSMSISPTDFPGCKPNSIYYTDDDLDYQFCNNNYNPAYRGARDLGVFNLENGKFEKHYYPTVAKIKLWPPPIWIVPTLMQRRNIVKKSFVK